MPRAKITAPSTPSPKDKSKRAKSKVREKPAKATKEGASATAKISYAKPKERKGGGKKKELAVTIPDSDEERAQVQGTEEAPEEEAIQIADSDDQRHAEEEDEDEEDEVSQLPPPKKPKRFKVLLPSTRMTGPTSEAEAKAALVPPFPDADAVPRQWQNLIAFGLERVLVQPVVEMIDAVLDLDPGAGQSGRITGYANLKSRAVESPDTPRKRGPRPPSLPRSPARKRVAQARMQGTGKSAAKTKEKGKEGATKGAKRGVVQGTGTETGTGTGTEGGENAAPRQTQAQEVEGGGEVAQGQVQGTRRSERRKIPKEFGDFVTY